MSDDTAPGFDIVEEHGSFLLIRAGSRFAVVEKRAGRIYPMLPGGREGEPTTMEGMAKVMAAEGWLSEPEARLLFKELSARGDRLARVLR
jgi:hypothetical protein